MSTIQAAIDYNKARYDKNETLELQGLVGVELDGYWGPDTVEAVTCWQKANDLDADGKIGPATYQAMRSSPGLTESPFPPKHVVPPPEEMWGYDHCPNVYRQKCPAWEETTSTGTFEAGLCLLVSGWKDVTFSRSPDSWISLDELSIGIAHWWSDTAPKLLATIAQEAPKLAKWAWGEEAAGLMVNENWIRSNIHIQRGKEPYKERYDWLLSGWWEIAQHPDIVKLCVREWLASYSPPGLEMMAQYDWVFATSLAGLIRLTNSRGAGGMRSIINEAIEIVGNDYMETKILETAYCDENLYDHLERWELIQSMEEFIGRAPTSVSADALAYTRDVIRVDGTKPEWARIEIATVEVDDGMPITQPCGVVFRRSGTMTKLDNENVAVRGNKSHTVKAIQRLLYNEYVGEIDGIYGPKTVEALAAFFDGAPAFAEVLTERALDRLVKRSVDELRRTRRDFSMSEMVVPVEITGTIVPKAERYTRQTLDCALGFWRKGIHEPPGENCGEIDGFIRDELGMYWHWLDRYARNGQSAWCGAFVAACFGGRLNKRIRQLALASTARIQDWLDGEGKNWGPTKEHPNRKPHTDRRVFDINQLPNDSGLEYVRKRIRPGDVVVVGNGKKRDGNHITLCLGTLGHTSGIPQDVWDAMPNKHTQRFEKGEGILLIEGNAKGFGPDGSKMEGVIVKVRPFKQFAKKREYYICHALRFSDEDFEG